MGAVLRGLPLCGDRAARAPLARGPTDTHILGSNGYAGISQAFRQVEGRYGKRAAVFRSQGDQGLSGARLRTACEREGTVLISQYMYRGRWNLPKKFGHPMHGQPGE